MIYIRLHQAGKEEIEDETSWMQVGICRMQAGEAGNFAKIAKFWLYIEISLYSKIFAMIAKFRYIAKFTTCSEISASCFCIQTTSFCFFHLYPHCDHNI